MSKEKKIAVAKGGYHTSQRYIKFKEEMQVVTIYASEIIFVFKFKLCPL